MVKVKQGRKSSEQQKMKDSAQMNISVDIDQLETIERQKMILCREIYAEKKSHNEDEETHNQNCFVS
jgi:hypothetical protein